MSGRERIAVTGVGIVSALGPDAAGTFRQICSGARGFSPVTLFDVTGQRSRIAAQVSGLSARDVAPAAEADVWSRSDALGVLAAAEALAHAGVATGADGLALSVGGTTGGMYEAEGVLAKMDGEAASDASVRRLLSYPLSTTAERISARLGPVRRAITLCSACSSGALAIVQGAAWLASRRAEYVLAGGTDGLCQLTYTGFNSLGAMDPQACRPFDGRRAGLSLGEGAGFLLLELESGARARGARVLAWLTGWSVQAEAHHITHPEPSGAVAACVIERALARAGRSPADVDYVNAHGTGTVHNDAMEARALQRALGPEIGRVFVSSSKGSIGHTLGAAGGIEAALTVLTLDAGRLPATGGLEVPDETLALRHVPAAGHEMSVRCALSNSFGFGGTGAVLVFEHRSAERQSAVATRQPEVVITGVSSFGPDGALVGVANAEYARPLGADAEPVVVPDPLALLEPAKSRRFDASSALVTLGAEQALADGAAPAAETGLVCGTAYGNVQRSVAFLRRVSERGPRLASPADFPHLVPSAPSGNASIYLGLTGPVTSVSDLGTSAEAAVELGISFIRSGLAERVIAGAAEPADPFIARVLSPLHVHKNAPARGQGAGWVLLESAPAAAHRGARVYARIATWIAEWSTPQAALRALPAPQGSDTERVLCANVDPELIAVLDESSWGRVARSEIAARAGEHEALGGVALACGAALVSNARSSAVLVCGLSRGRHYFALLVPPAVPDSR
ncbi:MAG TPA: beta-ketoacyl-[acyl-carrier-protein] synthase family protein [Polyangiaceae bacterium]|nr:beta-ketoacyl-[acyl-carrier-protein] synthase family protein [Polyangiaceae bacterium]